MAQWLGQFTGLTHQTKLKGAEASLRAAVKSFRAANPKELRAMAKAVRRLAARVLNLRLKVLKDRRNAYGPVPRDYAEKLQQPERAALAAGVNGILAEFAATDACE